MKEKNFQSEFTAWIRECAPGRSAAYELKLEKGTSFPFNRLADHQIEALQRAKGPGLYHKISDLPLRSFAEQGAKMMRFGKPKPFDCFFLCQAEAWLVLLFYVPRAKKEMLFIDIDAFLKERSIATRKSLTIERARAISSKVELLKIDK